MIPIEQQVISHPLAQRLAAMGLPQSSYFVWYGGLLFTSRDVGGADGEISFAAFTVPELAELLGDDLGVIERQRDGKFCAYPPYGPNEGLADTMAEALGLLLLAVLGGELAQNGGTVVESKPV